MDNTREHTINSNTRLVDDINEAYDLSANEDITQTWYFSKMDGSKTDAYDLVTLSRGERVILHSSERGCLGLVPGTKENIEKLNEKLYQHIDLHR